jgi:predicted GNAT family acetyltransferase
VNVVRHANATEFLARAKLWLERAEAENNVILGIAGFFESYSGQVKPYLLTIHDNGPIVGAALMTPPRRLLISSMPDSAVLSLAHYLFTDTVSVPGVLGPSTCARVFAESWITQTGRTFRLKMSERIYACEFVTAAPSSPGSLRAATQNDESLLVKWAGEFCREAKIEDETAFTQAQIPNQISKGSLYVWDNGEAVSMADLRRETAHGIAVSLVYTPPRYRNNGYATSCVAALTKRMLDTGKRFCCLYTDLSNSTSNSIYQRIGYQPVCDVQDWVFE